ncbi:Rubrerythrin [Clostridium cavendishii DSM 21758]|uniref:Rubrerythrin n=1 Tax=Clostridium cavendishii DSM 21758 TaxID=1121302 RepID=A0A1M6STE4_9CLOT|nr:ferritin family protein [Clostridium cavendishii]SHK47900.1 Rubrerythrin [Clostridium cavendishii DSM 21758]
MKNLHGTKTYENLSKAFSGECQARTRYTFYAEIAKNENHKQIESIFIETANNEKAHAKIFYDFLVKGSVDYHIDVNAKYPMGFGNTKQNLKSAADGKKEECIKTYPQFAKIALEEGFPEVNKAFELITEIEKHHERRFLSFLSQLETNSLYRSDKPKYWRCINCGFVCKDMEAPNKCPACTHPQGFFETIYNLDCD